MQTLGANNTRAVSGLAFADTEEKLIELVDASAMDTIALCFTAADRLLEREQMVLVPTNRADYAAFLAGLRTYAPKTLDFSKEADYIPESCDHNGHHHG